MGPGEGHSFASNRWRPEVLLHNESAQALYRTSLRANIGQTLARARQEPGCRTAPLHIEDDETYQHDRVPLPAERVRSALAK